MKKSYTNILFLFFYLFSSLAIASGPGFNDTTNQPLTSGTNPNFSVNVGVGSAAPGQKLDVEGTVRMTGFNLSTSPTSGYVLTSDASGNGTWAASGGSNYWRNTAAAGNVGISTTNTVGRGRIKVAVDYH